MQADELCVIFRANLKARRNALRMSQVQLAKLLGVDQGYISDLERGTRTPNLKTLAPLADALDTTPSALLSSVALAVQTA